MTCRVYVGEYQDRITGAAATAYVVIDENGRLVKAMAQKVKTNKGLSLQAVKLAVQGLGSRRKITEIRHRLAAIPYPVTLELAIGSAHSAAASTLARCVATRKKYCSPTARQYALLVSTL